MNMKFNMLLDHSVNLQIIMPSKQKILTLPIARSPLSNRSITPRNRNDIPKPARPTPISIEKKVKKCSMHSNQQTRNSCEVILQQTSIFIILDALLLTLCIRDLEHIYNELDKPDGFLQHKKGLILQVRREKLRDTSAAGLTYFHVILSVCCGAMQNTTLTLYMHRFSTSNLTNRNNGVINENNNTCSCC